MKWKLNDMQKTTILFSLADAFLYAKKEIVRELDKITLDSKKMPLNIKIDEDKLSKDILRVWKRAVREGLYGNQTTNIKQ